MLENILTLKKYSHKTKLTVKSIVAVSLVALAVVLPQIVHLAAGQAGGVTWLPMYLPVLLAGCQGMDAGARIFLEQICQRYPELDPESVMKAVADRVCGRP